jgi:DNA-directed RNA polymerase II subunit RPB1
LIKGITKVYMREEKSQKYNSETGTFEPYTQWVLDTDGCNLTAVLCVQDVDATRTVSNDIVEVFDVRFPYQLTMYFCFALFSFHV